MIPIAPLCLSTCATCNTSASSAFLCFIAAINAAQSFTVIGYQRKGQSAVIGILVSLSDHFVFIASFSAGGQ